MTLRFSRLDRTAIRRLKAGEKIAEHGIVAIRLPDGDLRWSVAVMVDGRRIHRVVGLDSEGATRRQAEEFIERARTDARDGRLHLPAGRKLALTFKAAAHDYLQRLAETGGKNLRPKRRHIRLYLGPHFGAMRLDAITPLAIERYRRQRRDAKPAPAEATINRELATLSHIFSKAVEWRWLDRLPVRPQKATESAGRIIALTDAECDALLAAAIAGPNPDLWLFIAFGLNTAMRHSEIMGTRWDQLDLANRRLYIPHAKAGERTQPITPELAAMLAGEREMREDCDGWIFPSPHRDTGSGHRARMDRPFRDAVVAAGLDPGLVTPHVMRHTAITRLVEAGVDLPTIQRISGHKTLAMVLRYAHVHDPHIDDAIRALGRTLPQPAANKTAVAITQELHTRPKTGVKRGPPGTAKMRAI
jgi:integrase